jgi:4-hydroxybenzoate polyprenyltransferase
MVTENNIGSKTAGGAVAPLLVLMRPHQWVKNAFVAAPLFFSPSAVSFQAAGLIAAAVVAFCLLSSAIYIVNDYKDQEADRQHPNKRHRPLAAGTVPQTQAAALCAVLLVAGIGVSAWLSPFFLAFAAGYVITNLAYSLALKRVPILDVMIIAGVFVVRLFAGAVLIDVVPSPWMVVCAGLLALFLALAKRRDDLEIGLDGNHRESLEGYTKAYLDTAVTIVLGALLVAYMMYTTGDYAREKFGTDWLYLTSPFVIAGVLRYLQITLVERRSGAPTRLVLKDRFLKITILGYLLTFGLLTYG